MEDQTQTEHKPQSPTPKNDLEAQLDIGEPGWRDVPEIFQWTQDLNSFAKGNPKFSGGVLIDVEKEIDGVKTKEIVNCVAAIDNESEYRKWDEGKVKECIKIGKGVARIDVDFVQLGSGNEVFGRSVGDTVIAHGLAKLTQEVSKAKEEFHLPDNVEIFLFREHGRGDEVIVNIYNLPNDPEDQKNVLKFLNVIRNKINQPKKEIDPATKKSKDIQENRKIYSVYTDKINDETGEKTKKGLELIMSLGFSYSGEMLVRKNLINEIYGEPEGNIFNEQQRSVIKELLDTEKSDKKDLNEEDLITKVKKLTRVLAKESERRSTVNKLMGDLQRLNGELFKHNNAAEILNSTSEKFGETRVTDNVLDNLLVFAATKGVLLINDSLDEKVKDQDLLKWISNLTSSENEEGKRKIISAVRRRFFEIFRKDQESKKESLTKTSKTYEEYKNLAESQFGVGWNRINSYFQPSTESEKDKGSRKTADIILENDPSATDSRLRTGFYTNETRTLMSEKITECITQGKSFTIGSVDANALRSVNIKGGYPLGDVFIERHASLVTDAFDPKKLGLSEGAEIYLVSRDAAGDEFIIAAFNTTEHDTLKLKEASEKLNSIRESFIYDPENDRKFTFSTSSSFVSDSEMGDEIINVKRELSEGGKIKSDKAYDTLEKTIKLADSNVKLTKAIFELENLPLDDLVKGNSVYDSVRLVCNNLGGGRIRKDPLKLIMGTILVRSAFEYCKDKNIGYDSAWKLYDEVFTKNITAGEGENRILQLKQKLLDDLKALFGETYGKESMSSELQPPA
jgi:GGDEF domain-containing protein